MNKTRHLQLVILSIMKDVDELCRKNTIEYYLLGGSAIGAVRHKGFIPWDDDLDIVMSPSNYEKFIRVCREQLDLKKYYLQVGLEDWPLNFTKIRLRGTMIKENKKEITSPNGENGIFLDIFKLENSPANIIGQIIQYVLAKYYLSYQLSKRGFDTKDLKKKLMMFISWPLKLSLFRNALKKFIEHYHDDTTYYGSFYFRTRFKTAFTEKYIFGQPKRVQFEDMMLPVPEHVHEYLTQMFGDYMTPPPIEKQVGLHTFEVDFGKFEI